MTEPLRILKPATITPASMVKLFEIFEKAGLPKGSANLVLGPGGLIGNELAEHKKVDCITFTGSTSVGQSIMRAAASNVKKIGLELGGKSPNILFPDIDIERAVEWAMIGIFLNQGEICSAGSRGPKSRLWTQKVELFLSLLSYKERCFSSC